MKPITRQQAQDTGMAMVLLLLLVAVALKREGLVIAAIVVHVVNMIVPQWFTPVAVVWLGASHVIGTIVSSLLLAIVYVLVVTPVGLVRRMAGKDTLRLRAFKAGDGSIMVTRNHRFEGGDLEKPY